MNLHRRIVILLIAAALPGFSFTSWQGAKPAREQLSTPLSRIPVAVNGGEIGDMLRRWYSDGTAAGNTGDYYDNRDGGHSLLNMAPYPQLQKIEYTEEEKKARRNWGMQQKVLPRVVFGNSSTSGAPDQSGSNIRNYYTSQRGLAFLFAQYVRNNLYIYPEHRDHDPGHDGWGGYGDLFPTNTPFLIASQGSSGSDQPFMRALPYVLAAFRPDVKERLVQSGLLMPAIQMILRITGKQLAGPKEYLTGKAHPTVFQGSNVDARAMVEMAHGIRLSNVPPIALIRTVGEEMPAKGIDYFDPEYTEKLADTPVVIARVWRGSGGLRKMVVSAEQSKDLNNRPLRFHWAVLRGDPGRITIRYRNPSRSVAEITVPFHARGPIDRNSSLESNRVDIGVFVHNGAYYSPPAFLTFYTLDNEARTYGADGRPLEIAYGSGTSRVSIADWKSFFDALNPDYESWPGRFLRRQFRTDELAGLIGVSEEFRKIHEKLLTVQRELNAAQKESAKDTARLAEVRKSVDSVRQSEKRALQRKMKNLDPGAEDLVQRVLDSLLRDPDLWSANAEAVGVLYGSAGEKSREALDGIRRTLVHLGVAEEPDRISFRLEPPRNGGMPSTGHLTRFEREMVERFNAILLSRIIFPGIVDGEWRENYVDFRIASAKQWRDVYRYAPDGTPVGWLRYQAGGIAEFNAEGLLVVEKDRQGRCIRGRVVRYELEPQKRDKNGRPIEPFRMRIVKMVPTDTIREYQYDSVNDWNGRVKY